MIFPISALSNGFVPTDGMPGWLRLVAEWNPVSALVAACRDLFGDPGAAVPQDAWPPQHPVAAVLLWSVAILVVFVPLATRQYQRIGR